MNRLDGKIALITGATSGIGEASAIRFAKAGATVIVTGRNSQRGEAVKNKIISEGGKANFFEMDVQDEASIRSVVDQIKEKYGKLDILFNNAGIFPVSPAMGSLDWKTESKILDINVGGVVMVTQVCFEMLVNSKGVILNNASVAGMVSYTAGQSYMYCASKAGVIKFTRLIAKKYGADIRANAICPGTVRTPIFHHFDEERYKSNIPMGRVAEAEDVASVANFLVSDDAGYINGAVIPVDGGQSL